MQQELFSKSQGLIAGVDEAGRGPLAGPVVAGAVILDKGQPITGLADSKKLSEKRREELAAEIVAKSLAWSFGWADAREIDCINILQATHLAMRRAIIGLRISPSQVEVDGNRLPSLVFNGRQISGNAVIGGDALIPAISAASIIAKVQRDKMMRTMDAVYPDYGFGQHKGYGTESHRDLISRLGPCPQHRRSFRPISLL